MSHCHRPAPRAWRRLFGIVCSLFPQLLGPSHRLTSLGRDLGNGRSISHFKRLSKILSGFADVVTSIDGTRLNRQRV